MENIDTNKKNQSSPKNDFGFNIDSNIYKNNNTLEIKGDFDDSFTDMNMEDILDVMGCKTRRDIISLLNDEPKFVSEISNELNIGQKAIIEHLRAMEAIGILHSSYKKIVRGRPRKYYDMPHDVNINISITKNSFSINISEGINKLQLPSGDEWSKLLNIEKRIDNGHWEAIEELKNQIRLYDNLKERAEYILERTSKK
ncbi:ArsR/SmtB family transcription factor [Methanobrevibacter sp. DSM 116169]|uniref:ArsR/SmtB family transcription factor n=1 Tax=Methanobrevibacter sp. DSM 116169 TaxID=3242727 RepID=UPI0038FC3B9D